MRLKKVFVRFYKSFNDDFLRKNDNRVKPKPWEILGGAFYPYIEVPIEANITTIVGANESGKSHLLSAIEKAISGSNIERSDFCRYSHLFTVQQNELKYPDFGTEWCDLSEREKELFLQLADFPEQAFIDTFFLFRKDINTLTVYLIEKEDYRPYIIASDKIDILHKLLPETFKIESDIALPSSVPIKKIIQIGIKSLINNHDVGFTQFESIDRNKRTNIIKLLDELMASEFFNNPNFQTNLKASKGWEILQTIQSYLHESSVSDTEKEKREKESDLAYKLICKIAKVDIEALIELDKAIKEGMEGYANGIINQINRQLSGNLNFPNYWVQDSSFCLKVMARDYDLVFTITDRTGTEYSFNERSVGLKYFLSYYIQYRSHEPHSSKSEILLMDEPDAYLSSQAQQDLLKIFNSFANPEPGSNLTHPIQVVYVTHSPFLIDKNHAERIRVLQKGNEDEGTRVVKDAAKNHYEPLRSSIGIYVGETAFIGNCNLMVEGIADQILIAGATTYLRSQGASNLETLDLNQITIVPSGSASHIPYLVYLARGRDIEQPAVVVLLDSDRSGKEAKKQLLGKGGQHRKPLLKEQFVLQIGDIKKLLSLPDYITEELEIEDLIPLPICIQAVKLYLQEFCNLDKNEIDFITDELVQSKLKGQTIFNAINDSLKKDDDTCFHVEKIGFARNVIKTVNDWSHSSNKNKEIQSKSVQEFRDNFQTLFTILNKMQRHAQQDFKREKLSQKIERIKKDFNNRHPISARREDAIIFLDEIENIINNTVNDSNESFQEIEAIQDEINNLRRDYKLNFEMSKAIDDYDGFKRGLERIKYAGVLATQDNIDSNQDLLNTSDTEKQLEEMKEIKDRKNKK
jgi:predicted ATPase